MESTITSKPTGSLSISLTWSGLSLIRVQNVMGFR